jgi:NSS family neurotransmitter:Na+ symporter
MFVTILFLSIPCALGFNVWADFQPLGHGSGVLDLEDFIVSNNLLPIGALVYLIFCVTRYGWGWDKFIEEADTGRGAKFPRGLRTYFTYVVPVVILMILIMGYIEKFAG